MSEFRSFTGEVEDIPDAVRTFIVRFSRSIATGRLYDIGELYEKEWRDLSRRHYDSSAWPTRAEVSELVDDDPVFLTLYDLQYHRHILYTLVRSGVPSLEQYHDAWEAFQCFFLMVMDKDEMVTSLQLPPLWVYDIMSDFLDHFAKFHAKVRQAALKGPDAGDADAEADDDALSTGSPPPPGAAEAIADADVWRLTDVLRLFYNLIEASDIHQLLAADRTPTTPLQQCGYFSLINLCRLHAKLGDYAEALDVVSGLDLHSEAAFFTRVTKCHTTLFFYVGFSLMMTRRFSEALTVFSRVLMNLQRTRSSILSDHQSSGSMIRRKAEQMLALLAVCVALCPGKRVDDLVSKVLQDKHGEQMGRMRAGNGEKDFEDLYTYACLKHLDPTVSPTSSHEAMYKRHLKLFKQEVADRMRLLSPVRSYLQLYTNIDIPKLATYCDADAAEMKWVLTALKMQSYQKPHFSTDVPSAAAAASSSSSSSGAGAGSSAGRSTDDAAPSALRPGWASMDSLHFYVDKDVVKVEELKPEAHTGTYLIRLIGVLDGIEKRAISGSSGSHHKHSNKSWK